MSLKNKQKSFAKILTLSLGFLLAFSLFVAQTDTAEAIERCEFDLEEFFGEVGDIGGFEGTFENEEFLDCQPLVTSFVEFEGGLRPPSGEGLAQELTQVRSAREFILNITNFVLSFLGLTAVLIIIYGGFLFVTARGNEEQSGNGKKTITYAVVGVVVVLISFALVNTLIREAPGGGRGSGRETRVSPIEGIAQERLFNVAALEIQSGLQNFLIGYRRMVAISDELDSIKGLPIPVDINEARNLLRELQNALNGIIRTAEPFSQTTAAARKILKDFVEVWLRASDEELRGALTTLGERFEDALNPFGTRIPFTNIARAARPKNFYQDGGLGDLHRAFRDAFDGSRIEEANRADFEEMLNRLRRRLEIVRDGLGPLSTAPASEFVRRGITSERELQLALSEIPPDMTIGQAFEQAFQALQAAESLVDHPEDTSVIRDTSKKLLILYTIVRDIKFMAVRINASVPEGNAPLAVQFTSVGSLDPSGETISDEQHEWDLDGNGIADEAVNALGCNEKAGASVTCVYPLAGTYRITLRLNPKGEVTQAASGISVFTLKVNPPRSRIHLEAQVSDIIEVLNAFDEQGRLTVNKNVFQVTKNEAEQGVRYDASKTTDGTGQPGGITNYEWIFGDGSNAMTGPTTSIIDNPKKTYQRIGVFPLRLQVTDKGGVQDRKFVNVTVTNIAARILARTFRGDLNTAFEFDGSRSTSDLGRIDSFEWSVVDAEGNEIENLENNQSETFRHTFETAGKYSVKLKVTDRTGEQAEAEVQVLVESRAPQASFVIRGCVRPNEPCLDQTQPSLIELDASTSFDPDEGDTLSYRWEVLPPANVNEHYTVSEGELRDAPPDETQKIQLKFSKTGTYKIKLTVEDQHEDPELRKSDSFESEIFVASVIDLAWDPNMEIAKQLDKQGEAFFTFKATAKNASHYKIDYGDGETFEGDIDSSDSSGSLVIPSPNDPPKKYDEAGAYIIVLTASDPENGETTIQKRIYVAAADTPIAIISLSVNNQSLFFEDDKPIDPPLLRGVRIAFDASRSLNTKGQHTNLEYSWDFGDGDRSSSKTTIHTYEDVSPTDPGYFEVILSVRDSNTGKIAEATAKIPVIGAKPIVENLIVRKISAGEETPLDFEVTAEGANDPDGSIAEYTFWYFDEDDPERKLGVVTTPLNRAVLTVETKGAAGEEKQYSFCLSMRDNENNVASCEELFPEAQTLPFVTVRNGPNQAPVANFSVDRTSIDVGDSVTFTSSSTDADGSVEKYIWDVKGDGFHNDGETELSQIIHTYTEKSPTGGYKVKLKVIDDRGAAGFSQEVPIIVDLPFDPPTADFTFAPGPSGTEIQFTGVSGNLYSRVSPGSNATLERFEWDFDTSREFCDGGTRCPTQNCTTEPKLCDRDPTNDPDALLPNPLFEYPASGPYEVRLTVEDSNSQKDDVVKVIQVVRGAGTPQAAQVLEAKITTDPPYVMQNNRKVIHLNPPFGNYQYVQFFFGDSLGNIQEYVLDKNIFFDSGHERPGIDPCINAPQPPPPGGGDGCADNDADIVTPDGSQTFSVRYGRPSPVTEYQTAHPDGIFRAQLTVYGTDESNTIITNADQVDIVFDEATVVSQAGAFLTKKFGPQGAIVIGLLSGAILALIGYWTTVILRKGKPRTL